MFFFSKVILYYNVIYVRTAGFEQQWVEVETKMHVAQFDGGMLN